MAPYILHLKEEVLRRILIKDNLSFAFVCFQKGAKKGNPYAVAKIISYYEKGFGVRKNLEKSSLWRQFIPEIWQTKPIIDYIIHLNKDRKNLASSQHIDIPEELLEAEHGVPTGLPDPNELLPEIKEEVERDFSHIYRSIWEETKFKEEKDLPEGSEKLSLIKV